jgi:FOG: TPR repeat, SEL1 subfamily
MKLTTKALSFFVAVTLIGCASVKSENKSIPVKQNGDISSKCILSVLKNKPKEALPFCNSSAQQGSPESLYLLGSLYFSGNAVEQDKQHAIELWTLSAQKGLKVAQYGLGKAYYDGNGVKISKSNALKWWKKAAEQGDEKAMYALGIMYRDGEGVPVDLTKVFELWTVSAQKGYSNAQGGLASMYGAGIGVERNDIQSYAWYYTAYTNTGDKKIKNLMELSLNVLSPNDAKIAKSISNQYIKKYSKINK